MALAARRCKRANAIDWGRMIPDRLFYPLAALIVAALLGLAMVWPQGQGAPSSPQVRELLTKAKLPAQ